MAEALPIKQSAQGQESSAWRADLILVAPAFKKLTYETGKEWSKVEREADR